MDAVTGRAIPRYAETRVGGECSVRFPPGLYGTRNGQGPTPGRSAPSPAPAPAGSQHHTVPPTPANPHPPAGTHRAGPGETPHGGSGRLTPPQHRPLPPQRNPQPPWQIARRPPATPPQRTPGVYWPPDETRGMSR